MWFVLSALSAPAATLDVCPPAAGCAYATVADALADSVSGDTIALAEGTYTEWLTIDRSVAIVARDPSTRPLLRTPIGDEQESMLVIDGTQGPVDVGLTGVDLLGFGVRPIEVHGASLDLTDVHVTGSGFQLDGGLLWAEDAHIASTGSLWVGGQAMLDGGQLFARDTALTLEGNDFKRGVANQNGGSLAVFGASDVTSQYDVFESNEALERGGAVALFAEGSPLAFVASFGEFSANNAEEGGALFASGDVYSEVSYSSFNDNHANGAGAISTAGGEIHVLVSRFKQNSTQYGAGALGFVSALRSVVAFNRFCGNYAVTRGVGVANAAGSGDTSEGHVWLNNLFYENTSPSGATLGLFGNAVDVRNNVFVRNTTHAPSGELELGSFDGQVRNNLFLETVGAILGEGTSDERLTHNSYWMGAQADAPGADAIVVAPQLRPDQGDGCSLTAYLPTWRSPLVDAGDPSLVDPDGTRSDVGVFGGPKLEASLQVDVWNAWWYDNDDDGEIILYDCNDEDVAFGPQIPEVWYDGVDQDCDFRSDYDQDLDGHDSEDYGGDDCDDLDPVRSPSTEDLPHNGIDEDCSGADLSDADGDGVSAQVLEGDKTPFADCDDTDPSVYPGALELDDDVDHDCDGFNAPPRTLQVRGCATGGDAGGGAVWLALALLAVRRRRQQRVV